MEFLGSIGIGFVCGWLAGMFNFRRRVLTQSLAILAAAGLVCLEVVLLAGWKAGLAALCSGLVALFVHLLWRNDLRQRRN